MIIGICGKSGSGKSTLANYLLKLYQGKCAYLEIDKVGHNSLKREEAKKEIKFYFGNNVFTNGEVDRKKLREYVFSLKKDMDKLTDITWKYMCSDIEEFISKNKDKIIILDWLLLPKSKFFQMCDIKILLDIPYEIRKERVLIRDNITSKDFDLRDSASIIYDKNDFDICLTDNNYEKVRKMVFKNG